MRSNILFLACSCAIVAVSCQKNKQNLPAPPVTHHETVRVPLKLTGDILLTESTLPNGRKIEEDVLPGAKDFGNNTLYSVRVRIPDAYFPLYSGLFSHPDSIYVNVPASGTYNVSVGIYKKGTGSGLYYSMENGFKYFDYPIHTALKNRMDTVTGLGYYMLDSVALISLVNPLDSVWPMQLSSYPEVNYFQGDTNFVGTSTPAPISINVKRRSFGVKFSAVNFTGGTITSEFSWIPGGASRVIPISVTPATINSQYHILASDDFRTADTTQPLVMKVTWTKPDGSQVNLGEKTISFKRNVLTTIHLTLASSGRSSVEPQITETDWSGNETINF